MKSQLIITCSTVGNTSSTFSKTQKSNDGLDSSKSGKLIINIACALKL